MAEAPFRKTYIKQWRKLRRLSLRQLAERLESTPGGDLLASHASLSRIENGIQAYTQPVLEAVAVALDCTVLDLLGSNPEKEGELVDIVRHLEPDKHRQALDYLRFLSKAS